MSEWKEYKLGEIAKFSQGLQVPVEMQSSTCSDRQVRFIRIVDITQNLPANNRYINTPDEKYIIRQGDVIMLRYGYPGVVADNFEGVIANNLFKISPTRKDVYINKYLYYFLKQKVVLDYFDSTQNSTTMPAITFAQVSDLDILLPSIEAQKVIVSILTSFDDKIGLLSRENTTLKAMAETLFRQWFVVEAKEEREEGKLGDYVDETIGGEWGKENPEGDFIKPVQCIRGTDIADLSVGLANKTPIRYVKESKFEKIEPRNGDIIMEISGGTENQSTGRVAYINEDVKKLFDYPISFSNFCRLLRVKEEYTYFIYCYLKYLYDQDEFFNLENGSSGIKNLDYKALLYELTYPIPSDRQQILDFNDKVSVYFEKINRNKQQIQTLIQTRDGLLPRLMGGEIKI